VNGIGLSSAASGRAHCARPLDASLEPARNRVAKNQNTFEKRRREMEKKQRAEEKRKRRLTRKLPSDLPTSRSANPPLDADTQDVEGL
jgi:siroheme synthase (precorrin-2 oxidase/ferrochelatase)